MEDEDCVTMYKQPHQNYLLFEITDRPYYLVWWILADLHPSRMRMCETMARLVCDAGLLIATDYRLKGKSFSSKICGKCDLGILENINHLVMQCPFYSEERANLHQSINQLGTDLAKRIRSDPANYFHNIMGKQPEYAGYDRDMVTCRRARKQTI